MALLEKELEIKLSTIPGSGQGLFTKTFIPKGTHIVEYKGRITTWKEVKDDYSNVYLYTIKPSHVIDARKTKKSLARYLNDAKGLVKIKGKTNNAEFVNDGLRAFVVATKNIEAGEEILVDYGKAYWDVVRQNQKIDNGNS
jgi:SET domain-containing protein